MVPPIGTIFVFYNTLMAAKIIKNHEIKNAMPPIGVIAPSALIPVMLNTYKLPEKMTMPANITQPAQLTKLVPVKRSESSATKIKPNECIIWY